MLTLTGKLRRSSLAFAVAALLVATSPSRAFDVFWTGAGGNDSWNTDNNWDTMDVPDSGFDDVAVLNGGEVVRLNAPAVSDAAGLALGYASGASGTLIIESGGSLTLVATAGTAQAIAPNGAANIGFEGGTGAEGDSGLIEVRGGGALNVVTYDINQHGVLRIGGGAGSASASSTGSFFSNGTLEVVGPGHTISIAANLTFEEKAEGNSLYAPTITGPGTGTGHSVINVGGSATLGGVLAPVFDGYTPQLGDSWDLIDAGSVQGTIDVNAPATAPGTAFTARVVNGGAGQVLRFGLNALPTLKVNTNTGAMSIVSDSGETFDLIGYSIVSPGGLLDPAGWNSLSNQGHTGWEEAGGFTTSLNELNAENSLALGGAPIGLGGSVFGFTEFGVSPDLTFEYAVDGDQTVAIGLVEYEGTRSENNLLLTVDPTTGEAELKNSSDFTVDIVAYSITSPSGSLDATGWTSLESQSVAGWDDADAVADEFGLDEFVPEDPPSTLAPGQAYSLGDIFQVGGSQDLALQFGLVVDGVEELLQGVVKYGAIISLPGDFNNDGAVNAADYTLWRDNLGAPDESAINNNGDGGGITSTDYDLWRANYGSTGAGPAASAPVPEPTAIAAALGAILATAGVRAGRRAPSRAG